jgi:hypothetical protein
MNTPAARPLALPAELTLVVALARLFQKLEASPVAVAPSQYRTVAERLAQALREAPAGDALDAVLRAFPAAAELYENVQYAHAGLCRQPLEAALNAELLTRAAIARVRGGAEAS